tara:strand:+ start:102 stop:860 length:759 start_codon:yes stop_codon:yes gene_type:complete
MQAINITCEGHSKLWPSTLVPFQGNLKDLTDANFKKLRGEILRLGFSEPLSVWQHDGINYVINGHQRLRVITRMLEDGYELSEPLPVNLIHAKNKKEAKQKVLALTSQYGQMTNDGLYEFLTEAEIDFSELENNFSFPEINAKEFIEGFTDTPVWVPQEEDKDSSGMVQQSQDEKIDNYMNNEIVHLRLPYARDTFKLMVDNLEIIKDCLKMGTHSDVVLKLVGDTLADLKNKAQQTDGQPTEDTTDAEAPY